MNESVTLKQVAYLPGDMVHSHFGGVVEPYWLNSLGGAVYATPYQPLFYSWNHNFDNNWCLSSKIANPYFHQDSTSIGLKYSLCGEENAKLMHTYSAANLWLQPRSIPNEKMFTYPIWSTWAQLKTNVNQSSILDYADRIIENGFPFSQIEIDDRWEVIYGDAKFDTEKFPDVTDMVQKLHSKNFLVTLWTHPFINTNNKIFSENAEFLVMTQKSKNVGEDMKQLPGLTLWWQGFEAGIIDFTREEVVKWWTERLQALLDSTGIDSFKFDAGENSFLPERYTLGAGDGLQGISTRYTKSYMNAAAAFGNLVEVRAAAFTQELPIFVRMLDKYSRWDYLNGLKSLIPTMLQFGLVGYPFVLPDMVGGNGYVIPPSRELYIRWMQANVFMPAIQLSYTPWRYDMEVVDYCKQLIRLHEEYAPYIIELAQASTKTGEIIFIKFLFYTINYPKYYKINTKLN